MHQDVWSRLSGGSGAPGWTLEAVGFDLADDGLALEETEGAYLGGVRGGKAEKAEDKGRWPTGYQKLVAATMKCVSFAGRACVVRAACSSRLTLVAHFSRLSSGRSQHLLLGRRHARSQAPDRPAQARRVRARVGRHPGLPAGGVPRRHRRARCGGRRPPGRRGLRGRSLRRLSSLPSRACRPRLVLTAPLSSPSPPLRSS